METVYQVTIKTKHPFPGFSYSDEPKRVVSEILKAYGKGSHPHKHAQSLRETLNRFLQDLNTTMQSVMEREGSRYSNVGVAVDVIEATVRKRVRDTLDWIQRTQVNPATEDIVRFSRMIPKVTDSEAQFLEELFDQGLIENIPRKGGQWSEDMLRTIMRLPPNLAKERFGIDIDEKSIMQRRNPRAYEVIAQKKKPVELCSAFAEDLEDLENFSYERKALATEVR